MPSAFVIFNVTHEAHRCNRHGCFDTCSKEEKDQQIHLQQSVRIHASPGTSLRIWALMCWCNGTSHSRLLLSLSEKKSISPRQVSIHYTGQVQGSEPSGQEHQEQEVPTSPRQPGSFMVLLLAHSIHEENQATPPETHPNLSLFHLPF